MAKNGGTLVAPPFGGYTPFAPPATLLPPPHRAHPAFYPPFVYWPYPSPPVSPTTYFGHAPPPPHVAPSIQAQHQATALFPVDFIPSTYQQSPASPSQPPTVVTTTASHQYPHPAQFHPIANAPTAAAAPAPPVAPPPPPLNGTYPGATQHLLTIDTNTSPLPLGGHEKLGTTRILTPAATTTFALAAAAAAVGPPTLTLQGSPVSATGPPLTANQYVELYIA